MTITFIQIYIHVLCILCMYSAYGVCSEEKPFTTFLIPGGLAPFLHVARSDKLDLLCHTPAGFPQRFWSTHVPQSQPVLGAGPLRARIKTLDLFGSASRQNQRQGFAFGSHSTGKGDHVKCHSILKDVSACK